MASDTVQQVKDRISIVDVVAPYVELHQAGKHLKGKSPFTSEKTPSFFVSPERNMYYCFSTSKGGDIFSFVQEMEGVDFKGALKILAEKAGVELVPEDPKKRSERDNQYAALEAATKFYEQQLPSCADAVAYLKKRGVHTNTIAAWRIGYAPSEWRSAKQALEKQGYQDTVQRAVGLVKGETGKESYDVFRDRIMFPISDPSGRVVGFSGRLLGTDSEAPKYVNSPETELFDKSSILYGYDKAKQGIRTYNFSLIVEGQFDVVLSHQAGYTNAVAVSGTAMTPHHVALLQRLSNRVVLALDADRAGIAAVKRAADVMLSRGMDTKVARLPQGKDPADMITTDPESFKKIIGKATHVIEFLLSVIKDESKDERTYKLRARDEIIPYLLRIENHIDRDHFETLVAVAVGTTKEAVHLEVIRTLESKKTSSVKELVAEVNRPATTPIPITRIDDLTHYFVVGHDTFPENIRDHVAKHFLEITGKNITDVTDLDPQLLRRMLFTIEQDLSKQSVKQIVEEVSTKLEHLRLMVLKERLRESTAKLRAAEASQNETEATSLLNEIRAIHQQITEAKIVLSA